jgi:hypothetical protein
VIAPAGREIGMTTRFLSLCTEIAQCYHDADDLRRERGRVCAQPVPAAVTEEYWIWERQQQLDWLEAELAKVKLRASELQAERAKMPVSDAWH